MVYQVLSELRVLVVFQVRVEHQVKVVSQDFQVKAVLAVYQVEVECQVYQVLVVFQD